MKIYNHGRLVQLRGKTYIGYPLWGMVAVMVLLYLAPFVSSLLTYAAFLLCLARIVRYDARVFSTDYCMLIPVSTLLQTAGGMSLLIYVCLFAAVWYFIRGGIRADISYVMLFVVLNYLVARMQMQISRFVLCFGQIFLLCVLLPKQDGLSAERTVKAFCASLMVASVYALVFRNTPQIYAIRGPEIPAALGSVFMRFQGLFEDPNYYMTLLVTALAMQIKLMDCRRIRVGSFLLTGLCLTAFGILTYSKTFFLTFLLLVVCYIAWQYRNKKYIFATVLTGAALLAANILLFAEFSPFSVVVGKIFSANNLSDLTTGRTDVFTAYLAQITRSIGTFLFGLGFTAEGLAKDPHNLYLEIAYYTGTVGLLVIVGFFCALLYVVRRRNRSGKRQKWIAKYLVLVMAMVLFFALHGMFSVITYAVFYMAFLPIMITRKEAT